MKTRWLPETIAYDGSQLRAHWIFKTTSITGDAMVAFRGPCEVPAEEMADLDEPGGPGIAGADMVHMILEVFDDGDLTRAVLRQRLLAAAAMETLLVMAPAGTSIRRDGDDLFFEDRKLSISVASRSLVSTLIHFAVNVTNEKTPVATASLQDLQIDPREFCEALMTRIQREQRSLTDARCKVRPRDEA